MANLQTKIRFNRVTIMKGDMHFLYIDAIVKISSSEEFTIEELNVISKFIPDMIQNKENYEILVRKIQEKVKKMRRPNPMAIHYMNALRKLEGLDYKIV